MAAVVIAAGGCGALQDAASDQTDAGDRATEAVASDQGDNGEEEEPASHREDAQREDPGEEGGTETASRARGEPEEAEDEAGGEAEPEPLELVETEDDLGELHAENAGRILFATELMLRDDLDDIETATSFSLDDPIYMRAFLEDSMGNTFRQEGIECLDFRGSEQRVILMLQVDDAPEEEWEHVYDVHFEHDDFHEWTSMIPYEHALTGVGEGPLEVGEGGRSLELAFKSEILPKLEPGEHELTFHAVAECHTTQGEENRMNVAEGGFTLAIPDREALARAYEGISVLPEARHPGQGQLRGRILEVVDERWEEETPLDVAVTSRDWSVARDERTGEPDHRRAAAKVLVERDETGGCRVFDITVRQAYAGGGNFSRDVDFDVGVGSDTTVPCPR